MAVGTHPAYHDQHSMIRTIALVSSSIGLVSCVLTLVGSTWSIRMKKHPISRTVGIHTALLIPATIGKMLPLDSAMGCVWGGTLVQVFDVAATIWLAVMTYMAASVCFFGVQKRKQVRRSEWVALAVVLLMAAVSVLPVMLWKPVNASAYAPGAGWCWIAAEYPETRLLVMLVPTLLTLVVVLGGVAPTTYYVLSTPRRSSPLPSHYIRKLSVMSGIQAAASAAQNKIGPNLGEKFTRPYARGICVYLILQTIFVWIPTFLARLQSTAVATFVGKVPASEMFSLGWSLVEVLLAPLGGFVALLTLVFLAYVAKEKKVDVQGSAPSTPPRTSMEVPERRLSSAYHRERKMSRKRSRILSAAGMEDVWHTQDVNSDKESQRHPHDDDDDDSSSSEDEATRIERRPYTAPEAHHARPLHTSVQRVVSVSPMPRRASKLHDPNTGQSLTWAQRRRLLLEQQHVPNINTSTKIEDVVAMRKSAEIGPVRTGSPLRVSMSSREASERRDMADITSLSDFEDDPMSMQMSGRRPSVDVFSP